ncbi:mucin-6-like [Homarus americanus]|uniref:mucin-6-like n=1 Tax=Homarus americanus TaxID=6706 RepID=UPI001C4548DA|nr:mucin-6-like [Homarus americanus]
MGNLNALPQLPQRPLRWWTGIIIQLSKVGGGSGDGIPSSTLQTSHPGSYVHGYPSNSSTSTSNSTAASTNSVVYNNSHSIHSKTAKNNGPINHRKKALEVGTQKSLQEMEYNKQMNQTPEKNRRPVGVNSNQPVQIPGCHMEVSSSNSNIQNNVGGTGDRNGQPQVMAVRKSVGWGSHMGHSAMCPHHMGGMTPLPGSPAPRQPPHLLVSPSWMPLAWPSTPTQSRPVNPRNPSTNINKAMWLPHQSHSSHHRSLPCVGTQLQQSTQAPQSGICPQVSETVPTSPHTISLTVQAKDTVPCSTTVTSCSNKSSTITCTNSKVKSPLVSPPQVASGFSTQHLVPYTGSGVEQTTYRYMNQQPLVMMPYYQYGETATPYYQWAAPVMMPWPLTPTHSPALHSTPTQTSAAVASPLTMTHSSWSPGGNMSSLQNTTTKSTVESMGFTENSPCPGPKSGSHTSSTKMGVHCGIRVQTPTCHINPYPLSEKLSRQTHPDCYKVSNSYTPYKYLSTPHETCVSPRKFPKLALASSPHQAAPVSKSFGSHSEIRVKALPPLHDDGYSSMSMTPPPTPLTETDNVAVANINES